MNKPNLFTLLLEYRLQLLDLARASQQHPFVLWDMILGHPVTFAHAIQVVEAFNELRGTDYEIEQLAVKVEG